MNVVLFLAADFANHETSGKLNVLGVFNRIYAKEFPAKHRRLYLVARITASIREFDTDYDLQIVLVDTDGNEVAAQQGQIRIPRPESGKTAQADLIIEVADLPFSKQGDYEFTLIINREVKASLPIEVVQIPLNAES
ncbi:MAG: hypothetical protein GC179_20695 [Anaerolineaceae bacterium]|nr:hypothetical protein [Anaerolineaceae bacterium]